MMDIKLEDVKDFLKNNEEALKELVKTNISLEDVKNFLGSNEEGVAFLQSYTDKKVTQGIKTFKENNLEKLVEAEILKRNPQKTPEQLKIEELERKMAELEKGNQIDKMKLKYSDELVKKGLNDFADFILSDDEEVIKKNIEMFEGKFQQAVQQQIDTKLKTSHKPENTQTNQANVMTLEKFMKLSLMEKQMFKNSNPDDYNNLFNNNK